ERVVAGTGEDLAAVAQTGDGRRGQLLVVGRGGRADVGRGPGRPGGEARGAAVLELGHRVGLADVEVGVLQRRDRTGVVQEGVAVLDLGGEAQLPNDVLAGVT